MGNVARHMIGQILSLLAVITTSGLGMIALQQVLERRVRVAVRVDDRATAEFSDLDAR